MRASIARHAVQAVLALLRRCRPARRASSQVVVLDDFPDRSRVMPEHVLVWGSRRLPKPENSPGAQTPAEGVGE